MSSDNAGTVVHVCAPNDANGNPRRLFLEVRAGRVVCVVDEGYEGEGALGSGQRERLLPWRVNVTATEYRRWLKIADALSRGQSPVLS